MGIFQMKLIPTSPSSPTWPSPGSNILRTGSLWRPCGVPCSMWTPRRAVPAATWCWSPTPAWRLRVWRWPGGGRNVVTCLQCGAPQVMWTLVYNHMNTVDISIISPSYWRYKPTERYLGGTTLCSSRAMFDEESGRTMGNFLEWIRIIGSNEHWEMQ